ncbi:MAG: hypothetical protein HYY03_03635 [Chloroflexi bacterium]|nr:hypothetical protein [Chloroflexota bacterium]
MEKPFDEILAESIAELEAGRDVNSVLRQYPEHAEALRPFLQIWASLSAAEKAEPSPQGAALGRQRLLSQMSSPAAEKGRRSVMDKLSSSLSLKMAIPFVAGAAVALFAVFLSGNLDSGSGSTAQAGPFEDCILQLDFNGNGQLDVGDVAAFRDAIANNDPAFDFNGDGTTDIFDALGAIKGVVDCLQQIQPPIPTPPSGP